MSDYDKKCELCGTPVRVVGSVTQSYESAYQALLAERDELEHKLDQAVEALSAPCEECELLKLSETNWKQRQIKLALDHEALKAQAEALADALGMVDAVGMIGPYDRHVREALAAYRAWRKDITGEGGMRG